MDFLVTVDSSVWQVVVFVCNSSNKLFFWHVRIVLGVIICLNISQAVNDVVSVIYPANTWEHLFLPLFSRLASFILINHPSRPTISLLTLLQLHWYHTADCHGAHARLLHEDLRWYTWREVGSGERAHRRPAHHDHLAGRPRDLRHEGDGLPCAGRPGLGRAAAYQQWRVRPLLHLMLFCPYHHHHHIFFQKSEDNDSI